MTAAPTDLELREICRVARRVADSLSIVDAVEASNYRHVRPRLTTNQLRRFLLNHPEFIEDWIMYMDNKRTTTRWYLGRLYLSTKPTPLWETGYDYGASRTNRRLHCSPAAACARFIVKDLDSVVANHSGRKPERK